MTALQFFLLPNFFQETGAVYADSGWEDGAFRQLWRRELLINQLLLTFAHLS